MSYALGEDSDTLVRASYGQFASQLGSGASGFLSGPVSYSYAYYFAYDDNRDGIAQPEEFGPFLGAYGFDPDNPTDTSTVNRISPDLTSPRTHELIFGVDRELPIPNSALTASVTYRRFTNFTWSPLIGITSADYGPVGTHTATLPAAGGGGAVSQELYAPLPGVEAPVGNGSGVAQQHGLLPEVPGLGAQLHQAAEQPLDGQDRVLLQRSPGVFLRSRGKASSIRRQRPPARSGTAVWSSRAPGGSGKSAIYFVSPKFQFVANGLYQAPFGINIAANLLIRQGYGQPYFEQLDAHPRDFGQSKNVLLAPDVGANRLPAIRDFNLRIGKEFRVNTMTMNVDLDWFNILNRDTVLGRQYDISTDPGATGPGQTLEIMNPSLLRLGFRLGF